jgi:hypothetical protein
MLNSISSQTLGHYWSYIFPQFLLQEPDGDEIGKSPSVKVDVSAITERLRQQFSQMRDDDRQQAIPRKDWIKEAMEVLVHLKLAKKHLEDPNIYEVDFKPIRNPLTTFAGKIKDARKKKESTRE